ncbi:MAG: hypothetical protein Kow0068_13610 [Marinilabiliales bacterium]
MGKEYLIGDFLKRIKRPITLSPNKEYKLVTIKMNHKGVVLRGLKKGGEIKSNMYEVKEGDFILSGIDARNGAFGIIPKELDGAIVTNDFWYFEIDENIISKRLFLELTATTWFDEICKKGSDGTTQRIRLQKDKFFSQKVALPLKEEQNSLLNKLSLVKTKRKELINEIQTQKELVKQLKQSILQEAIQGKLTQEWRKQNPDVEPASELLKRIKAEKAQLIKDKKIRKEKPLAPITEDEIPFELPNGWVWCRFKDIANFQLGKTPASKQASYWTNGTIEWLNISDMIDGGFVYKTSKKITEKAVKDVFKTQNIVPVNTLLMSFKLTVGKVSINKIPLFHNEAIISIFPYTNISQSFLFNVLPVITDLSASKKVLMGQTFNSTSLANMVFPLPPIAEQKAIVEKVESLMQKITAMEEEIQKSEQNAEMLMQAVLKEAFEGKKDEVEVC